MKIECPHCFKNNNLNIEAKVVCGHCKKELSGYSYKKPLLSATTALVIGAGGFYVTDKYVFSEDRYPIKTEYSILSYCVNSYDKPMSRNTYNRKNEVCICAFEKTMVEYSYSDYKVDEGGFLRRFKSNRVACM